MSRAKSREKKFARLGICLGMFAVATDWSIANTALPTIQRTFFATLVELQWVMNAFSILLCTTLVTMGRCADIYGRKKLFIIGLVIFGLSALFAGASPNMLWLITSRAFQGFSAAILFSCSQALLVDAYPANQSARATGLWAGVVGAGLACGPVIGGFIIAYLSWRFLFYSYVPVTLISLILVMFYVRESAIDRKTKVDWSGMFFLMIGIAALVAFVIQGPEWQWLSKPSIVLFIISSVALTLFIINEITIAEPIIQFHLLNNRVFVTAIISGFCLIFFACAAFFLIPLFLHNVKLYSYLKLGSFLLFVTLPIAIVSPIVGTIIARLGTKPLILFGLSLLILSAFVQSFFNAHTSDVVIIFAFLCFGLGWAFVMGPSFAGGLSSFPKQLLGTASGVQGTMQEVGGALGLAIVGSLFRSIDTQSFYRDLANNNLPLGNTQIRAVHAYFSDPEMSRRILHGFEPALQNKIMMIFNDAFTIAYQNSMLFLCALTFVCLIIVALFASNTLQD